MKNLIVSRVKAVGFVLALAVSVSLVALYFRAPKLMETLEDKSYDLRFIVRGKKDPGKEVVIVAIDDKSIKTLGRWPWPRATMARLVDELGDAGAKVIAFDILFNEKERGLTAEQAASLSDAAGPGSDAGEFLKNSVSGDKALAEAMARFGKVVLSTTLYVPVTGTERLEPESTGHIERFAFLKERGDPDAFVYLDADRCDAPIEAFADAASSMGHIYAWLDRDGTMRWDALSIKYDLSVYPSLGLAAVREYLEVPEEETELVYGEGVRLGERFIPTDEHGRLLVNYYGPPDTFKYYSFTDVINGEYEEGAFKDKMVLVGATAMGIYDLRVTPFSGNMPGVEKHATVIQNVLSGKYMQRSDLNKPITLMFILAVGIFLGLVLPRTGAVNGLLMASVLLVWLWIACYTAMVRYGIWLDLVYPTLAIALVYLAITAYRFMAEELRAGNIKRIFSHYVTPKMVEQLAKNPELAKLGGEKREITVLFSDVRGFTTFSESREPEEVVGRLNEYMGEMVEVIFEHDGTVDKFVGDAIMAFWGAPLPQDDQAERAVMCAAEMVRRLMKMQERWASQGMALLDMGVGINTGGMVIGNMGAEGRKMDYTVIGDHVNLGSRVEGLTKNYDAKIIITEFTYSKIRERLDKGISTLKGVRFTELDSVKVKGKEKPVVILRVDPLDADAAVEMPAPAENL